jgi:hypothetical protein
VAEQKDVDFAGHLTKPVRRHELGEAIERAMLGVGAKPSSRNESSDTTMAVDFGAARVLVVEDNITNQRVTQAWTTT